MGLGKGYNIGKLGDIRQIFFALGIGGLIRIDVKFFACRS